VRGQLRLVALIFALCAALTPASAQEQIKIGTGYGLAFLPIYVIEDMKLIEKHAKAAHLDVRASFQHFLSAELLGSALETGDIEVAPFGTAALLDAWQKGKGTDKQIFAVSGLTSLPLTLLSNQPGEKSFADLTADDRIAVPTATSPQMFLLQIQSEKVFGQYDKLQKQIVVASHSDSIAALVQHNDQGVGPVTAYFASPPFTQFALRDPAVHPLLTSADVMNGKFSFLMLGATKAFINARPQMPQVIAAAIDEAAKIIHDDPRRAAGIYLTHEPSGSLGGTVLEAIIRDIKDEFGSPVYGVQTLADWMAKHGQLKGAPGSWKDIVAPALANSSSS
jgi:NitT/TauT family transport system substrate-binding protein